MEMTTTTETVRGSDLAVGDTITVRHRWIGGLSHDAETVHTIAAVDHYPIGGCDATTMLLTFTDGKRAKVHSFDNVTRHIAP